MDDYNWQVLGKYNFHAHTCAYFICASLGTLTNLNSDLLRESRGGREQS